MCSTIRPEKEAHCCRFFSTKHICDAPSCSFHPNPFFVELVKVAHRSRPSMCAPLSPPPKKTAHCPRFFSTKHICDAPTYGFHQNLFLVELVTAAQRSKPSKCARLSAPKKGPTAANFFQPSIFVMPQPVAFTGTGFWSNWSWCLRYLGPPSVLDYAPPRKGPTTINSSSVYFPPTLSQ